MRAGIAQVISLQPLSIRQNAYQEKVRHVEPRREIALEDRRENLKVRINATENKLKCTGSEMGVLNGRYRT